MPRQNKHNYFLSIAKVVATQSTCRRRRVGCVLVSGLGHILATGYNGTPRGWMHCTDVEAVCGNIHHESGKGLDACKAVHAEQNALMQCPDVEKIDTVYLTCSPCVHCIKMLLNTSAVTIIYSERYSHQDVFELWQNAGKVIKQL